MHILASHLKHLPVVSFQAGEPVAQVLKPVIDPDNLKLVAFYCRVFSGQNAILILQDVRRFTTHHIVIDSETDLANPDDIVRLANLITSNFNLLHSSVITELGRRLGRVSDYAINLAGAQVQTLYVQPPGFSGWISPKRIIDRNQIIDVNAHQVTVRDATVTAPAITSEAMPTSPG